MKYVFTDGSAGHNGYKDQVGGWAFVITDSEGLIEVEQSGGERGRTNNWGELYGALQAINYIKSSLTPSGQSFFQDGPDYIIYTDSSYLLNCITKGWYITWCNNGWLNSKKEPVANRELWEQLIPYFDDDRIAWAKVKAHSDYGSFTTTMNNYVDKLAVQARKEAENG